MNDLDYLSKNLNEFKQRYGRFALSVPPLTAALTRALNVPVVTDKSNYIVLGLSKLCVDRFEDILILCSQGRGEGAMPLVRAMFEGLVNASYVHDHPEKADDFIKYLLLFIKKVQRQAEQLNGRVLSAAQKKTVDDALESYFSSTRERPRTTDWTNVNFVDRAKDVGLGDYVVVAYYRPIEIAHPSMLYLYSLSKDVNGKKLIFGGSEDFVRQKVKEAPAISHRLAIDVLVLLYKAFGNENLKTLIDQSFSDYSDSWTNFDLIDPTAADPR
jgi:ribosomal protein S17